MKDYYSILGVSDDERRLQGDEFGKVLSKYGEDLVHAAETASMTFAQIQEEKKKAKEEEKERKAAEREAKRAAKAEADKPKYDPSQEW